MVQPEKADVSRGWKNLPEMGKSCWKPEVLLLHTWWLFSLFAATFQKRNKYIYLTRPQYQDPSLSHWEMGWNKRVILWSARQIFLSFPTRPPALYFEERWSLRQPPSDRMGQPVWPGSANGCDDSYLLLTPERVVWTHVGSSSRSALHFSDWTDPGG